MFDAAGLVVAPGFVDPHTHYDAQLLWDPTASPSSSHGVTTVVGGNCGFSLAPLHDGDADYLRRMMARVEGMPLPALEQGVDWKWETFGEFLDRFEGGIAVNAGFLVGHCAIRRYVMGDDAIGGEATPEQIAEMRAEVGRSLDAGALGFSFTQSSSHSDGDGQPVASRWATPDELIAMSCGDRRPPRHHARGHRAGLPRPVLRRRDRAARVGQRGGQPPAQLERAHRRRPRARARAAPALGAATGRRSSVAVSSHSPCRCRCR